MGRLDEHLSEQFAAWEVRGRGWDVFPEPVELEPPFRPFIGYTSPPPVADDGRKPTVLSSFLERLRPRSPSPAPPALPSIDTEPEPRWREPIEGVEIPLILPLSRSVPAAQVESFLRHVGRDAETLALELLGTEREATCQMVAAPQTVTRVVQGVEACFPGIVCAPGGRSVEPGEALSSGWHDSEPSFAVVELGLGSEWMLPLGNPRSDVLATVVAALDGLRKEELGLLQILFAPARRAWAESVVVAVSDAHGKSLFINRPDLRRGAQQKIASPLFAVVIRLAASAVNAARAWEIIADLAAPFAAFARPGGNFFAPLNNEGYSAFAHEADILTRSSRRSGVLLNMEELIPLLTPPVSAPSRKLLRETQRTHSAPERLITGGTLLLGTNRHAGKTNEVFLTPEHRVRHTHVIGASGTGKSTFLLNLIQQDIERGEGVAVLDPHGDLIDAVLGMIPPERTADVIVLDPSDENFPVGLNILAAHSDFERNLLASDLTSVFRRLSTSWGDQMESVLRNGILAFLESSRGGTLADLRRFLLDAAVRKEFLTTVTDPEIVYYWTKAFPQLSGGKSIGPLLTRLDEFLSRKPIRYMVSQWDDRLDFSELLDRGGILLAKLPQGLIGRENTALLGSLITAKLQMAAMSRQRMPAAQRRDFWCYMDEFQHFITPSMAEILAGARKYRLGLILAHQELRHLDADRDVASAVLSNCLTRVVFKVGDADARTLESGFSHFEARDLMNLGVGEAVCRAERSDDDFNLTIPARESVDEQECARVSENVIVTSRTRYARPRAEIEAELRQHLQTAEPVARKATAPTPPPAEVPSAVAASVPVSEVPQNAASELVSETAEEVPTVVPVVEKAERPAPVLGRGGPIHRDIQNRIKAVAEEIGFRATLESQIGTGGADLLLERLEQRIAVEISVTTGVTHEVGNLLKCLTGNYGLIALIAADERKAKQIIEKVREGISETAAARIGSFQLETFVEYLRALPPEPTPPEPTSPPKKHTKRKVKGWTIKTKVTEQTSSEDREKEEQALRAIAEALRRPPP